MNELRKSMGVIWVKQALIRAFDQEKIWLLKCRTVPDIM